MDSPDELAAAGVKLPTEGFRGTPGGLRELRRELSRLKHELYLQRQELKAKNQELHRHLQTLSHELKAPLISLRGFLALLQEYHLQGLNGEASEYLNRIHKNIDQMERLVNDVLEVSKIEISEGEYEQVEVGKALDEALAELRFELDKVVPEIRLASSWPTVRCNRHRLIQVFVNLLGNAMKYSQQGRRLVIEVGYLGDELFHKFYVRDNGVGIPLTGRDKLFEMFGRLGNKKGVEGTGLGLAIVKRIIQGHGGEVWVESRPGRGATFYFTLPRQSENRN